MGEGGGESGLARGGRAPVIVGSDALAVRVEDREDRVGDGPRDPETREGGAHGPDQDLPRLTGSDDEAGGEDVRAGAGLGTGGEVDQPGLLGGRERGGGEQKRGEREQKAAEAVSVHGEGADGWQG